MTIYSSLVIITYPSYNRLLRNSAMHSLVVKDSCSTKVNLFIIRLIYWKIDKYVTETNLMKIQQKHNE